MTIICTICTSELHTDVPSALSCGHVFHKECIDSWISSTNERNDLAHCPLCNKPIYNRKNKSLFFSFNNTAEAETLSSVEDKLLISELQINKNRIERENQSLLLQLSKERENSRDLRQRLDIMRLKKEEYQKKVGCLKQIKSVCDMDEHMAQPATQEYLQSVTRLPRAQLVVSLGAFREKCAQVKKERDIAVEKHTSAIDREIILRSKVKKLTKSTQNRQPQQYREEEYEKKEIVYDENSDDDVFYTANKYLTSDIEDALSDVVTSVTASDGEYPESRQLKRKRQRDDDDEEVELKMSRSRLE